MVTQRQEDDEVHNLREFDKLKAVWVKKSRVNQLRVGGVINTSTAIKLREEGEQWIERLSKNYAVISFDMEPATPKGTVCVSLMLCWLRYSHKKGVELEFVNLPLELRNIITLSGLKDVFRVAKKSSAIKK